MGDSYRPSRRPDRRGARPSLSDRNTSVGGGGDSYRPNDAQNRHQSSSQNRSHTDFTFTVGDSAPSFPPTGPASDSRPPRRPRNHGRAGNQNAQRDPDRAQGGGRRNQNGHTRSGRRGGFRRRAPHERPLLQSRDDDAASVQVLGLTDGPNKFRDLDDLSDEETDMDLESRDESGESAASDQEPSRKARRQGLTIRADGDSVPKWSNPDPYTVLPPTDDTAGKKKDVVKLIRKAKNQASEQSALSNAVAANDDFIGFDDDNDVNSDSDDDDQVPPNNGPPLRGSLNEAVPTGPKGLPNRPPLPLQPQQPGHQGHKRKHGEFEGDILQEWLADPYATPAPWVGTYEHLRDDMTKW